MSQADFKFCQSYLGILKDRFSGLNLTRIQDLNLFHVEQFQDSLAPLEKSRDFQKSLDEKKLLLDVGFGGGFPILPLAFRCPSLTFMGFERKGKKVKAVKEIAGELGLSKVFLFHLPIEEVEIDVPCLITFKGVGSIRDCLRNVFFSHSACEVFFYKGPRLEEKEGGVFQGNSHWKPHVDLSFDLEHTSRRLLSFKSRNVPHGTSRKNLVKLSSLF